MYSRFRFKETDAFPLKNQGGTAEDYTVIDVYGRTLPAAAVEYRFLSGDEANYAGMADSYAAYLAKETGLVKTGAQAELVLELFGAVRKDKAVLGVPATVLLEDAERFVIEAEEKGGKQAARDVETLVEELAGLFAGGELNDEEKDGVMAALNEAYWMSKGINKKYAPNAKKK